MKELFQVRLIRNNDTTMFYQVDNTAAVMGIGSVVTCESIAVRQFKSKQYVVILFSGGYEHWVSLDSQIELFYKNEEEDA